MLKRFLVGAAVGGAAVYLFDPEHGAERRQKLMAMWNENREPVIQAGRSVSGSVQEAAPKVKEQVSQRIDRSRNEGRKSGASGLSGASDPSSSVELT